MTAPLLSVRGLEVDFVGSGWTLPAVRGVDFDIFPGEIDTPLMDKRPQPPTPEQRAKMLQPEDLAACVMLVLNLPPRAVVEEITIRPSSAQI